MLLVFQHNDTSVAIRHLLSRFLGRTSAAAALPPWAVVGVLSWALVYGRTAERAVVSEVWFPAQRPLGSPGHTVLFGLRGSLLHVFSAAFGEELITSERLLWAFRSYYLITLK